MLAHRWDTPVIRGARPVPEPVLLDREIPLYAHGLTVAEAPPTPVDHELEDGEALDFDDAAHVVHAPGRTDGSIGIRLPRHGVLFTGDRVAAVGPLMPGVFDVDRRRAVETSTAWPRRPPRPPASATAIRCRWTRPRPWPRPRRERPSEGRAVPQPTGVPASRYTGRPRSRARRARRRRA
ncbi:hypothetical protein ACGFYY_07045 [Streptomyces sp. NPDC048331]|uniref:hypothetical protein n=1 Tax=Streptomyces sp. NPDC048331 TaxID=3365534 RepID=UPI003723D4C2